MKFTSVPPLKNVSSACLWSALLVSLGLAWRALVLPGRALWIEQPNLIVANSTVHQSVNLTVRVHNQTNEIVKIVGFQDG